MKHNVWHLVCVLLFVGTSSFTSAREPKEYDKDVNYDEARLPHYDLPPLLLTGEGKKVTTAEEWFEVRRPQIMSLFSNLVYGRVPEPKFPITTAYEVVATDGQFMGGKATRKDVKISFTNELGKAEMLILVFVPNGQKNQCPASLSTASTTRSRTTFRLQRCVPVN